MGDFKDSSSTGDDYTYDVNGNINRDNNRRMHGASNAPGAVFNILDKADSIVIADKATTYYYYDAGGAMLAKKVNTYRPTGTTVKNYQYLGGFVYLNDTLQYTLIEGGRIRYAKKRNSATGATFYAYEYDYFISDHMGNVRSVVTEGRDTAIYQATMETARQAVEDATFANVYTPTNTITNKSDVPAFDSDGANLKVSVLNGNNNKVGAAIVLKVMAGDKIQLSTYAYYNTIQPPVSGVNLLSELLNVLAGGVVNNSPGKLNGGNTSAVSTALSPNVTNFLNNDRAYDNTKPKAYLNWIFFDNEFNFISGSSDAMQVDMAGSTGKKAMVPSLQTMPKNGYLYVYISNESNQNVYFDDITVRHTTGPLMQEQAYYPYGLEIQGLSDKALMKAPVNYKYNGGNELEDEDGTNYQNTFFRKYDMQIGRFTGTDILAESTITLSPYQYGNNNPIFFNDPSGARSTTKSDLPEYLGNGRYRYGGGEIVPWWQVQMMLKSTGQAEGIDNFRNDFEINSFNLAQSGNGEMGFRATYSYLGANRSDALLEVGFGNMFFSMSSLMYKSADAAAIGWSQHYQQNDAYEKTREFSGVIWEVLGPDNQKYFQYTRPIRFLNDDSKKGAPRANDPRHLIPATAIRMAAYIHSHYPRDGFANNEVFSPDDQTNYMNDKVSNMDFYLYNWINQIYVIRGNDNQNYHLLAYDVDKQKVNYKKENWQGSTDIKPVKTFGPFVPSNQIPTGIPHL
jgi:RHS repeat-associated protein